MRLHSPKLVRAIRARARAEVRASPALKKEARRTRRSIHINTSALFWRMMALGFVIWLLEKAGLTGRAGQMLLLTIWSTLAICGLIRGLFHKMYETTDITALHHLPVADSFIFKRQWSEFLRRSAPFALVEFALLLASLALMGDWMSLPQSWLALVPAALGQSVVLLSLTLIAAAYAPRVPYQLILWVCVVGVVIPAWIGRNSFMPLFLSALETAARWPFWVLPTGWMTHTFSEGAQDRWISALMPIPALVFLAALAHRAYARLAGTYMIQETVLTTAEEAASLAGPFAESDLEKPFAGHAGITAIEDRIRDRQFLEREDWAEAPLTERTAMTLMSPREQDIIGPMLSSGQWSRSVTRSFVILAVAGGVAQLGLAFGFGVSAVVFYVVGVLALLAVAPLANPLAPGFASLFLSGTNIPLHAGYPVGFSELSRIILKIALIRWTAALPLILIYAGLCALMTGQPILQGAALGLKGAWLLLVAQPCLVVMYFSSESNDTARMNLKHAPRILFLLFLILGLVGTGIGSLFAKQPLVYMSCAAGSALFSALVYFSYRRSYNRVRFDLIQQPQ